MRGSIRREVLWGAEASETVAGSYALTHGWMDGRKKMTRGLKGPTCKYSSYVPAEFIHIFIFH